MDAPEGRGRGKDAKERKGRGEGEVKNGSHFLPKLTPVLFKFEYFSSVLWAFIPVRVRFQFFKLFQFEFSSTEIQVLDTKPLKCRGS
jgi:hypothetical protein